MKNMRDRIPVCRHGSIESIDPVLVTSLEELEHNLGDELTFSSGYRCKVCNAAAGGVKNSAHIRGKAVDILVDNSGERFWLVYNAVKLGFKRIGVGRNFVHLDVDYDLPNHVLWLY